MNDSSEISYHTVINTELQYSIWPTYKPIPAGWEPVGQPGTKSECLEFIAQNWTDMRPLSLRQALLTERQPHEAPEAPEDGPSLVDRLCQGEQQLRVARCETSEDFAAQLRRNYVLLEVSNTRGRTELGCAVTGSCPESDSGLADTVRFQSTLNLDGVDLVLNATIERATQHGTGTFALAR